ncbi:MAG: NAD(P)H-dependent oxidoreductase subunit E [Treponema sp.]|nr:NAD(P)H-dependent oxidoreductase subunit E [Treponema sp.]
MSSEFTTIFEPYPQERRYALAMLMDVQNRYRYIPREALEALAAYLANEKVKVSSLYSMVTFYRALSLEPKGQHVIKVCDGTACHLRGTPLLLDTIKRRLNLSAGETSQDKRWSLETVNCLGACALAPVMVIDDTYHPQVKAEKVGEILAQYEKPA